jgi:hypothetical protein
MNKPVNGDCIKQRVARGTLLAVLSCTVFVLSPFCNGQGKTDPIGKPKAIYERELEKIETECATVQKASLAQYLEQLELTMARLKARGDVDSFFTTLREKQRLERDRCVPYAITEQLPNSITTARREYYSAVLPQLVRRDERVQHLTSRYIAELKSVLRMLVSQDNIHDGEQVNGEIKRVEALVSDLRSKLQGLTTECSECHGSGRIAVPCIRCKGLGLCTLCKGAGTSREIQKELVSKGGVGQRNIYRTYSAVIPCPTCNGTRKCTDCQGTGAKSMTGCAACRETGRVFADTKACEVYFTQWPAGEYDRKTDATATTLPNRDVQLEVGNSRDTSTISEHQVVRGVRTSASKTPVIPDATSFVPAGARVQAPPATMPVEQADINDYSTTMARVKKLAQEGRPESVDFAAVVQNPLSYKGRLLKSQVYLAAASPRAVRVVGTMEELNRQGYSLIPVTIDVGSAADRLRMDIRPKDPVTIVYGVVNAANLTLFDITKTE